MKTDDSTTQTAGDKRLKNPAKGPVHLEHATILGNEEEMFAIATAGGEIRLAARADGCLLRPEKGDLVLVSLAGNGAGHVLNVLHKNPDAQTQRCLDLDHKARITTRDGTLGLHGENLHLVAAEQADMTARSLRLQAMEGQAHFMRFRLVARQLYSVADKAHLVARSLDQRVGRMMQRLGSCFRRIQGMEHVVAERVSLHVRKRLTQKAGNASLEAEENVTINGKHIDLG